MGINVNSRSLGESWCKLIGQLVQQTIENIGSRLILGRSMVLVNNRVPAILLRSQQQRFLQWIKGSCDQFWGCNNRGSGDHFGVEVDFVFFYLMTCIEL